MPLRQLFSVILSLFVVGQVLGQAQYTQHKHDPKYNDRKVFNKLRVQKQAALKSGNQGPLEEYYTKYLLLAMSMDENHGKLADWRIALQKDFQRASPTAYSYIRDKVFAATGRYALSPKYHPAVRYNAMLIFGSLNETEPDLRASRPAQPYSKTLKHLLKGISDSDAGVRVAALLGVRRHAELQGQPNAPEPWSAQIRDGVCSKYLQGLINAQTAPAGLDQEVHDWMRQIAVEAVGFAQPSPSEELLTSLMDIMADAEADKTLRCQCADTIGRLDLDKSKVPANKIVELIALVAADCGRYEISELTELAGVGRRPGMMGRPGGRFPQQGMFGNDNDNSNEPEVADDSTMASRRRLLERLTLLNRSLAGDAKLGVGGIAAMSDGKAAIAQVQRHIRKMIDAIQRTDDELLMYGGRLKKEYLALKELVPRQAAEALDDPAPIEETAPVGTAAAEEVASGN